MQDNLFGVTGSKEPTWPAPNSPAGMITEDGSIVWVLCGSILRDSSV